MDDTVDGRSATGGTGFKFTDYTPEALVGPSGGRWRPTATRNVGSGMQRNAMKKDYSWDVSAREYVKVYGAQFLRTTTYGFRKRPDPD